MNALDTLYHSIINRRPGRKAEECSLGTREKGKPVMIGPAHFQIRALIQHIPESPRSMHFHVQIVASADTAGFQTGDVLATGETEKAALRAAQKVVRNQARVS